MMRRMGFVANSSSSDWIMEGIEEEEEEEEEEEVDLEERCPHGKFYRGVGMCLSCGVQPFPERKRRVVAGGIFDQGSLGETLALFILHGMTNEEIANVLEREDDKNVAADPPYLTEQLLEVIRVLLEAETIMDRRSS